MQQDRPIEIERGPNKFYDKDHSSVFPLYNFRGGAPPFRTPPSILHINKETREEALNYWTMIKFDSRTMNSKECWMYYNPNTDIVYFSDNSCIRTILHTFQKACKASFEIPRIAINATNRVATCCNWEDGYDMEEILVSPAHAPFNRPSMVSRLNSMTEN